MQSSMERQKFRRNVSKHVLLAPALIIFLLLISTFSFAQKAGVVAVTADPRIDSLLARRLELNREAARGAFISMDGFRVQIFSGSDRNKAYAEQARFKGMHPLVGCYITYTQPNYKIRVGDFRTRLEAEKFMSVLRPTYPTMFIFPERINLPR